MRLNDLSTEKRSLLASRAMALSAQKSVQRSRITPISRAGELPLSFAQQRLWFLNQLEPDNPAYNMLRAYRLAGKLHVPALRKSLNEIVRRHEILRTTFTIMDGGPVQVIAPASGLRLPIVDIGDVPEAKLEARAQQILGEEAQRCFDLSQGPLVKAMLLRLGHEKYIFLVTMHHIVSDGWSMGVFFRELKLLYEAFSADKSPPLPQLPIQYADFAVWQRQWLAGQVLEAQLSYWKEHLRPPITMLELPTDRLRPPVQTHRGASHTLELSKALTKKIKALSRQEGVTLFMTLLAGFNVLLHRLSGQDDITVGSPIANRNWKEIEDLIGFFVNTLALRTNLTGNPTFRELLSRVRTVTLRAYVHQDLPFEKLVEELQPERDLSRSPLFQVFFNMLDYEYSQFGLHGLRVKRIPFSEPTSKFDLTLYAKEQNEQIELRLVYNTDLFDGERIAEMLEQLKLLLVQTVENPGNTIHNFSTVAKKAEVVLPDPTEKFCHESSDVVHTRFAEQVRMFPENAAVIDAHGIWSYTELNAASNQTANYLRANSIQSGDVVAIYGCRSVSLVSAILGVLKAGAAFLILDPALPAAHVVRQMQLARPRGWIQLEDAGKPTTVLEEFVKTIPCRLKLPRNITPAQSGPLGNYTTDDPEVSVSPDELAYVAFTSGSTDGKPRGIIGTHRPLSHFLRWHCHEFGLNRSDRFSMLSGLSHDPLLRDIFTPLSMGAVLCIPTQMDIEDHGRLAHWMQEEKISVTHLTPAMGETLAQIRDETAGPDRIASLRYLFFGGDLLTMQNVARIRKLAPNATCVNFYGATETPQAMGYFIVADRSNEPRTRGPGRSKESVPIGRGIKDAQLLILNPAEQLAGIGEIGEICVRTPYLSKGYLDDDELTAEKFIINHFTNEPDDYLYKTGDLGRYSTDGNVEICGRIDRQVKIRGFRVELGEVESVLSSYEAIKQCVVTALDDKQAGKKLVAYIVCEEGVSSLALRRFLKDVLPDYMIPSRFIQCDSIPLTANGKTDYALLDSLRSSHTTDRTGYIPPHSHIELTIAEIWQNLLGVEKVGLNDNFFDLGGHSLMAVRTIAIIERKLKVRMVFRDFVNQTLAQFAASCQQRIAE